MTTHSFLLLSSLLLASNLAYCQSGITSSGGNGNSNSGDVSYSIGQPFYIATITPGIGAFSQGIQQAFTIEVLDGINDDSIDLQISIYPNPVVKYFHISINDIAGANYSYRILNIQGQELANNVVLENTTLINAQEFPNSNFIVEISKNNLPIKTFKIIKN